MRKKELEALEADGWRIGTVQALLDLPPEDALFIEMKVVLAKAVKEKRAKGRVSQTQLAARMGSSQPRVAKLEKGETSIDQLVRALLAMGASPMQIGRKIGTVG